MTNATESVTQLIACMMRLTVNLNIPARKFLESFSLTADVYITMFLTDFKFWFLLYLSNPFNCF